jgi:hypothetical protein
MVSVCREISLLCFVAVVLTFFIAGLLFICASEHVDNLGAYTVSRPETGLLIPSDYTSCRLEHRYGTVVFRGCFAG